MQTRFVVKVPLVYAVVGSNGNGMCLTNVRFKAELILRELWPRRRIVAHGQHNGQDPCFGCVRWTISDRSLKLLGTLEPAQPEGARLAECPGCRRRGASEFRRILSFYLFLCFSQAYMARTYARVSRTR
jgi:hypothetical protein